MKFESLKNKLIADLAPVIPMSTPLTILLRVILIQISFFLIIIFFTDSIPLSVLFGNLNVVVQIIVLSFVIGFSSYTFIRSSIPGEYSSKLFFVTILITVSWPIFTLAMAPHSTSQLSHSGWLCSLSICLLSILPLITSLIILSRTSSIFLGNTRYLVFISSGGMGALLLCFLCPEGSFSHLLTHHILPVFLGAFIIGQILSYKR